MESIDLTGISSIFAPCHLYSFREKGLITMSEYRCPLCGKMVQLVQMGEGWIGACCNEIIYNARQLPEATPPENREASEAEISFYRR
jgi:hypothetical protein